MAVVRHLDELIQGLEGVRDAIAAKNSKVARAALMYVSLRMYGYSPKQFADHNAVIQELQDHLEAKEFDEASTIAVALLTKFKAMRE